MKLKRLIEELIDKFWTTKEQGHAHVVRIDVNSGDGNTILTTHNFKPNSFEKWEEHEHQVKNWKVLETKGHTHEIDKSARG